MVNRTSVFGKMSMTIPIGASGGYFEIELVGARQGAQHTEPGSGTLLD